MSVQAILDDPALMIMATGALVGTAAALLGPFLILRQNAMLSDAISHSIVFGIVVVWMATGAVAGPVQIVGAALTGVLTVVLTEVLVASRRVHDDAAIGLVFPVLFSLGVLLLNLYASDVHIDAHTVLLGEIGFVWLNTVEVGPYLVPRAVLWMGTMTLINLVFVLAFWKELKLATFDPLLAHAFGLMPRAMFYALLFLTSSTAVAAFDAVGAILFIAFIIAPPAAAYLLTDRLWKMLVIGVLISLLSTVLGYWLAVRLDVSIGGTMAAMTGVFLTLAWVLAPRHGLTAGLLRDLRRRRLDETRALVVHLATHEGTPEERHEENRAGALGPHLGWTDARAGTALRRSLAGGYVLREGEALHLTPKGRATAEALLEPWRRG
ncbi:MAG TPA: metal ABC transporter permease [Thermohalobaculum sp.]|nr:metal ABC transporter permease [Thermohalobaculum sp.]